MGKLGVSLHSLLKTLFMNKCNRMYKDIKTLHYHICNFLFIVKFELHERNRAAW